MEFWKQNEDNFKSSIGKFEEKKRDLISEIEDLKSQISHLEMNTKWVDWVGEFGGGINDLRSSDISILD